MEFKKDRVYSLDVFRGITIMAMIIVNTPGDPEHVFSPLTHSEWNGCTPTDIVFPCFIFIMGVAVVFAQMKKKSEPALHGQVILKAFRKMITLILLGWFIQLVYHFNFATLRFPGVLPRLGLVYFFITLLYIKMPVRYLLPIGIFLLIGYYALVVLVPFQGSHAITPTHNIVTYVDHLLVGSNHLAKFSYTDPCGLLSTLPAIVTGLIGLSTGLILKNDQLSPPEQLKRLLMQGFVLTGSGILFSYLVPFNKPLWSSSYTLYTGGVCMLAFAFFYWLIDVKQVRGWNWIFNVLGVNAIFSYMLSEILPFFLGVIKVHTEGAEITGLQVLNELLFAVFLPPKVASLFSAITFMMLIWSIMYIFYKRKILIKI